MYRQSKCKIYIIPFAGHNNQTTPTMMTDYQPKPTPTWTKLSDRIKIELQNLQDWLLEYLTYLHGLEYSGRTIQVGSMITLPDDCGNQTWQTAQSSTLEQLLRVVLQYYQCIYPLVDLQALVQKLLEGEIPSTPQPMEYKDDLDQEDLLNYAPAVMDTKAL